jgi:hypothetical protein
MPLLHHHPRRKASPVIGRYDPDAAVATARVQIFPDPYGPPTADQVAELFALADRLDIDSRRMGLRAPFTRTQVAVLIKRYRSRVNGMHPIRPNEPRVTAITR